MTLSVNLMDLIRDKLVLAFWFFCHSVIKPLTFSPRVKKIQMDNLQWCMKQWWLLKVANDR